MITVLGWIGSGLVVFSLAQTNPTRLRSFNLIACIVLFVFDVAIGLWSAAILNVAVALLNLYQLWTLRAARRDEPTPGVDTTADLEAMFERSVARAR